MSKKNYIQDPKTKKLAGSYPDPAKAPESSPMPADSSNSAVPNPSPDYAAVASAFEGMTQKERQAAERREVVADWARRIPTRQAALKKYLDVVARDLDITYDDAKYRYDLLKASASVNAGLEGDPMIAKTRYVCRSRDGLCGTPLDEDSLKAIASLEDIAADYRRDKRALIETVDEQGTRWVRYANDTYSEVLRAVHYDAESHRLTVHLVVPRNGGNSVYTYKDVDPSIVRHLISARSMGRFYSYVFSGLPDGGSLENKNIRDYTFLAHYSNFMWPSGRTTGVTPTPKAIEKAQEGE